MVNENQSDDAPAVAQTASAGQGLLMIGAAVILVGYVIFSVFMGEFTYSAVYLAISALVLMTVLGVGGMTLGTGTLKLLGQFMGLVAVFLLIRDLRFGFPSGFADNLANITFYVGAVAMFIGARSLD